MCCCATKKKVILRRTGWRLRPHLVYVIRLASGTIRQIRLSTTTPAYVGVASSPFFAVNVIASISHQTY
ncbi:hypothetical protein KCP73_13895 [Salmonella enterica subsp. enterica]|nr:hypothetical protein KCP73_13895 [Salmonella enterica subsp. enterica]